MHFRLINFVLIVSRGKNFHANQIESINSGNSEGRINRRKKYIVPLVNTFPFILDLAFYLSFIQNVDQRWINEFFEKSFETFSNVWIRKFSEKSSKFNDRAIYSIRTFLAMWENLFKNYTIIKSKLKKKRFPERAAQNMLGSENLTIDFN